MSPKQWLSLLTFYILYLIFGAAVFYHMEHKSETQRRITANSERIEINALLKKYLINGTEIQEQILDEVSEYCGRPVTHPSKDEYVAPYIWSFYHAFFFSFTVCSTVGYGNIFPTHNAGRLFLIFYGLVGLPVHAILFAYMGNFWGNTFINMYKRYKEYKMSMDKNWVPRKVSLIGRISMYLLPGMTMFIFAPAMIFSYFEGWDYLVSVYYAFVTLTTIGLGDFVATFQKHQEKTFGTLFIFYQLFILCWFIAGVSYIAMIIGFLIKGLRSKKIKRIEHNLAINIKETQRKIWHGVQKDVGYIRKILNEVYFSKFKPVYKDPDETKKHFHIPRSQSCPHLFMYNGDDDDEEEDMEDGKIKHRRERAFSECFKLRQKRQRSASAMTLNRPQSDSDLSHIDRVKTFDAQRAALEPGELLAKVTIALGGYRMDVDDENVNELGIHGFSDSEILASEQYFSDWSIQTSSEQSCNVGRNRRALSEVRIPIEDSVKASNEWTWSGANTQISEIEKIRARMSKPKKNLYRASFQTKLRYDSDVVDDFPRELPHTVNGTATNKSMLRKLNPFKRKIPEMMKRHSLAPGQELDPQRYIDRRESISSVSRNYLSHARASIFSMPCYEEEQSLLETTSVADLIRAIEMFHIDNIVAASNESLTKRRKMGTDHLSHKPSLLTLLNRNHHSSHTIHGPTADIAMMVAAKQRGRLYSCALENMPFAGSDHNNRGRILGDANPFVRKQSISAHPPPPPYSVKTSQQNDSLKSTIKRRFSVRPAELDRAPGQFHKVQNLPVIPGSVPTSPQPPQQQQTSNPSPVSFARKLSFRTIPSSLSKSNEH